MPCAGSSGYDDGGIACDDERLVIRHYYPWGGKEISYASIRGVTVLPLNGANRVRRWRLWGSGDLLHWWNLDRHRPKKDVALVLDVGGHVRPTITPNDSETVERILREHISSW
jgi:hypothetical protein